MYVINPQTGKVTATTGSHATGGVRDAAIAEARYAEQQMRDRERAFMNMMGAGGSGSYDSSAHAAAAQKAAQQMKAASDKVLSQQKSLAKSGAKQFEAATTQARSDLNPWRQAGVDALGKLQAKIDAGPGEFTADPGYQFRLAEGQRALDASAAARGGALSGRALKEGMRYSQDFASNEYDKFMDRYYRSLEPLQRMSESGQTSATQQGQFAQQGARDLGNFQTNMMDQVAKTTTYGGEAQAKGTLDAANIMAAQQQADAEKAYANYMNFQMGGGGGGGTYYNMG